MPRAPEDKKAPDRMVAENRKAFHDFHLLETFEAGLVLLGTEVKAIREGRVNLRDSFARVEDGEVFLYNVHISPYSHRGYADHEPLRVVLATIHIPLREVPRALTPHVMEATIALTARELPRFGIAKPRIAVAGLNPHAGEHGLFGHEEETAIAPAIAESRAKGIDVSGPFPGDTIFVRARRGEFDVVVACYHDQGLIPVKLVAFGQAVNVTLGLPIIRTSVDHGTAFDIAGKGVADPESMITAVLLAAKLARGSA